ncbi:hypothetical protein SARC_16170, partial [Sphaeroforma arctica JP610]
MPFTLHIPLGPSSLTMRPGWYFWGMLQPMAAVGTGMPVAAPKSPVLNARQCKIHVVTPEWVWESVNDLQLLDEERFNPSQ